MLPEQLYLFLYVLAPSYPTPISFPFSANTAWTSICFFAQLFANRVSGFFGMHVIVSSLVLWAFVYADGRRYRVNPLWAPILANLVVGVSLGLPLFLYLREARLERSAS